MVKPKMHREILPALWWASMIQLIIAFAAAWIPEMGDLTMFKLWANQTYENGIHQAFLETGFHYDWLPLHIYVNKAIGAGYDWSGLRYLFGPMHFALSTENVRPDTLLGPDFRYDWLPLYLYVSKAIGAFYYWSGLRDLFGPWSRVLSMLLKSTMIGFHIVTAYWVYAICRIQNHSQRDARFCCLLFVWQPGIIVATCLYGYQDAFHTVLLAGALLCLLTNRRLLTYALCALIALTKPQAAIYLVPFACFGLRQYGLLWCVKGVLWGLGVMVLALSPFLFYGTFSSVFGMFMNVTNVHEWLTGCAHNFWWLVAPVPPFESDRLPLLFGFNGLEIGLFAFAVFTCGLGFRLFRDMSVPILLDVCALFGFGFFMVVTEIHENHHYAMFLFLAPLATTRLQMRWAYYILSGTFVINLITTNLWLESDLVLQVGFLRIETLNAMVNAFVLFVWLYIFFKKRPAFNGQSL
ncbi:MAG: hypothetical protein ACI8V2_003338 [Candidatus Latescibacterota bacterium]|jgi:hypothetical protein